LKSSTSWRSRSVVHVLLIEQDPDYSSKASTVLSQIPECRLHIRPSHSDGLWTSLEKHPNIILFAHGLPGRDSLQVFASIREKFPSIPLIAILSAADHDLCVKYKSLGAADCIRKDAEFSSGVGLAVKKAIIQVLSASRSNSTTFISEGESDTDELLSMLSALKSGDRIFIIELRM
jgi:DNA-binding NarL/FixJ family response regulator